MFNGKPVISLSTSMFDSNSLIGVSSKMKHVFESIKLVSNTNTTVLIRGESGTGKELVAKTIHYNSERANKPFIAVNCAAIPKDLHFLEKLNRKYNSKELKFNKSAIDTMLNCNWSGNVRELENCMVCKVRVKKTKLYKP